MRSCLGAIHIGHKPYRPHVYTISTTGQTILARSISATDKFGHIHIGHAFLYLGKMSNLTTGQTISVKSISTTDKIGHIHRLTATKGMERCVCMCVYLGMGIMRYAASCIMSYAKFFVHYLRYAHGNISIGRSMTIDYVIMQLTFKVKKCGRYGCE